MPGSFVSPEPAPDDPLSESSALSRDMSLLTPHQRLILRLADRVDRLAGDHDDDATLERISALTRRIDDLKRIDVTQFPIRGAFRAADVVTSYGFSSEILSVALSSDGSMIALGTQDGMVRVISRHERDIAKKFRVFAEYQSMGGVLSVAFSPDSKTVAIGGFDSTARILSLAEEDDFGRPKTLFSMSASEEVSHVAYSPCGRYLAFATGMRERGLVRIVQLNDDSPQLVGFHLTGVGRPSFAFHPDGERIVFGGIDIAVRSLVEREEGNFKLLATSGQSARSLSLSPDGEMLALGGGAGNERTVRVVPFDDDGRLGSVRSYHRHYRPLRSVSWSPGGEHIAVLLESPPTTQAGTLFLLAAPSHSGQQSALMRIDGECHTERMAYSATFSADGSTLALAGAHRIAWLFGQRDPYLPYEI